jgi:hypothetical protein
MLERDYIMRLIREFMAALQRILEKKEIKTRREKLKEMYEKYVGPYSFYYEADMDAVMKALAEYDEGEQIYRMEMLAELYYAEADTVGNPDRDFLLEKAYLLYDYIDKNGRTYSLDRKNKMTMIKSKLKTK